MIKETSIEDKLETDNIQYGKLPNQMNKEPLVTAKAKEFTKTELTLLTNQEVRLSESQVTVISELDKPVKLGENKEEDIRSFVNNHVLFGDKYRLSSIKEKEKQITFYQHYDDKKMFENINGKLELKLNGSGEIVSYEQTLLEDFHENGKPENVLPAFQAIQTLYKNGLIKPNSKISNVELGYYTVVQLTESQVLSPTWYFKIKNKDKEEELYVNAYDGSIYQTEKDS
nr:two-component system regulatory protein YycI [Bacillus ectoiniformans]